MKWEYILAALCLELRIAVWVADAFIDFVSIGFYARALSYWESTVKLVIDWEINYVTKELLRNCKTGRSTGNRLEDPLWNY